MFVAARNLFGFLLFVCSCAANLASVTSSIGQQPTPETPSYVEMQKKAESGNAAAQFNLGVMYENGWGVKQDYTEAVNWYKKSADQGNAQAQCNLGLSYDRGQGLKQDDSEAVRWYKKAADQGYAQAQNNLGVSYATGRGVKQDYAESIKWSKKAADQGDVDARNNLRIMYTRGERGKQNKTKTISRVQNISITRNINDEVLSQLAKDKFGGNMHGAVRWVVNHPKEYGNYVSRYIERAERRRGSP